LFDRGYRLLDGQADAVDHGVVGQLGTIPAAVPIHREIAADDGRDGALRTRLAGRDTLHGGQELAHKLRAGFGRRIPTV
jgi:hypothetical protein